MLNHVTDVMASHADLLEYAASQLRTWAANTVDTDDAVASRLHALGGGR